MNIKKLAAGALTLATAGATFVGFAAATLDDYVTNSDGTLTSPMIVVPSYAGITPPAGLAQDIVGAADIAAHIAGYATTTVSVSGAGTSVAVSNGASLDTPNQKLYLGDAVNAAKQTLTNNDLPDLLKSGTVTTGDGDFDYDQYISLGSSTIAFGNSNEEIDPVVHAAIGTDVASPAYTYKLVFQKALVMNDTDTPGETIEILGVDYTISSDSTNTKIVLFGSGNTITLVEGESTTATVGGTTYELTLIGVSDENTAILKVDDDSDNIDEGTTEKIGGLSVYAKSIFYLSKESQVSSATFQLGSEKLTLQAGNEVKVGDTSTTSIDGTNVTITGSGEVSSLEIAVAAEDDDFDHVSADLAFTDPVFGSFKFASGGVIPAIDSTSVETIEFGVDSDDDATVQFTDKSGNTESLNFANNNAGTISLADSGGDKIYPYEGANVSEGEYIMVDSGDFGHLFEVDEIDPAGATDTGSLQLKDVITGNTIEKTIGAGATSVEWIIDGQTYYFNVGDASTDTIVATWGTGASAGNAGTQLTVFPTIETSKGALLALTDDLTLNLTTLGIALNEELELPGGELWNITGNQAAPGQTITLSPGTVKVGYNVTYVNATGALTIGVVNPDDTDTRLTNPAVVVVEEQDDDNEQNAVIADVTYDTDNTEVDWNEPAFTNSVGQSYDKITTESDNKVSVGRDEWGSYYEYDSDPDQKKAALYYPDYQSIASFGIGTNPTFSVGGTTGTVEQAVLITSPVGKLDSEVNTATLASDLILIGGPCANTLVAELAADNTTGIPACSDWTLTTGLIKEVSDAFGSGHMALVVAGTQAKNTRSLAAQVMQGTLDFEE